MNLVTISEAASSLFVVGATVRYWLRTGKIDRYYRPALPSTSRKRKMKTDGLLLVDLDQCRRQTFNGQAEELRASHPDLNLLTTGELIEILHMPYGNLLSMLKSLKMKRYLLPRGEAKGFMISGEDLYWAMTESRSYWHHLLTEKKPTSMY
jgi:hypothetical protein